MSATMSVPAGVVARTLLRRAGDFPDLLADAVHFEEIGAHAVHHDFLGDVDHVRVAHLAAIHHIRHLHAGLQFAVLRLRGEDADLARFPCRPE